MSGTRVCQAEGPGRAKALRRKTSLEGSLNSQIVYATERGGQRDIVRGHIMQGLNLFVPQFPICKL